MRRTGTHCIFAVGLLAAGGQAAAASPPHKHEHGVASLQVALDGAALNVHFSTPLDNLLGFEHAPRTEAQRQTLRAWSERLRRPEALFRPTPAAGCQLESSRVEAPLLDSLAPQLPAEAARGKTAAAAEQAGSAKAGEHAHLEASLAFRCRHPERLRELDAAIFAAAPRLRRIDAQLAGPKRQSAARLTPERRTLTW